MVVSQNNTFAYTFVESKTKNNLNQNLLHFNACKSKLATLQPFKKSFKTTDDNIKK